MRNIRLTIQYDGTHYSGWQIQKNAHTIQAEMKAVLEKLTGEKVNLVGSGRTDAGVHARAQIANFRTNSELTHSKMLMALNSHLPKDIVVTRVEDVDVKFNAQHDAVSKIYRYTISNTNFVDPFIRRYAAKCFFELDINKMRLAAKCLVGKHDFKSFQATEIHERDSVRTIKNIKIEKDGVLVYIDIEADGFLYNMVRNIAGTLIEVGRGKFTVESVKGILDKKDRRASGPTAPAHGLCLMKVKY
jgi:tRNA pseudouridine38-40 synthase